MKIDKSGQVDNTTSSKRLEQKEKPSDVQFRESAGEDKLREASYAHGAYGRALVNKPDKVDIKSDEHKGLKKTEIGTKEEAIAILKKFGFSDELMKQVDFNDKNAYQMIFNMNAFLNSGVYANPEEICKEVQEYSDKEKLEIFEYKKEYEFITYMNKENIDFLKQYIEIDENNAADIFDDIVESGKQDEFVEKLPVITILGDKITKNDLKNLKDFNLEIITPERMQAMKQINEVLPEESKISPFAALYLSKPEESEDKNVSRYVESIKYLKEHPEIDVESFLPSGIEDTILTVSDEIDNIKKMLTDTSIDFEGVKEGSLSRQFLSGISKRKDLPEIQAFVTALSKEAKDIGIKHLPDENSTIPKDKLARIYNILSSPDFGKFKEEGMIKFIDSQKENGYKNLDGIADLLELYKGTGKFKYGDSAERYLLIENDDYEGAVDVIKLNHELKKSDSEIPDYRMEKIIHNKDIDFKEVKKMLSYLNEKQVSPYIFPEEIYTDKKGYNKMLLRDHIKDDDNMRYYGNKSDEIAEIVETDDEIEFAKKILTAKTFGYGNNSITAYSTVTMKDIVELYKQNKEGVNAVIDIKDDKGNPAFTNTEDIKTLAEVYLKDKDGILSAIDTFKSLSRRMSTDDVSAFVISSSVDADLTDYLLKMKIKPYDDNSYSRFDMCDIKKIVEASQNNSEFADYLINAKEIEVIGLSREKYRFCSSDIISMLNNLPEDTEFLKTLIEQKHENGLSKYNGANVVDIATALKADEKLTKEMLKEKKTVFWSDKEIDKYSPKDIKNIVLASSIDKEYTEELKNEKCWHTPYDIGKYPRYEYTSDILKMVQLAQKYGKENVEKLAQYTNKYKGVDIPVLVVNQIKLLLELEETNKDDVEELLQYKLKYANGDERMAYHSSCIENIIEARKINKEYTNELLKINAELDFPKTGEYIKSFVEYEIPSELFTNNKISANLDKITSRLSGKCQKDVMRNILGNFTTFSERVDNLENTCLANPQKYINGEMSDEWAKSDVENFFDNNYINLLIASDTFDSKTMNVLLRKRFDDAQDYLDTMKDFNSDDLKLLKDMSNCTNNDDKPFLESQKIDFINLINAYKKCALSTDIIKEMTETGKIDIGKINLNLLENMMKKSGFTDEEIQNMPKEKLMSWDMNYMHLLVQNTSTVFKDLIRAGNSEDFEKYISYTSNVYGKANEKTKSMYDEMGMNYDKWIHPDKSHNIQFVAKDENLNKLEQVAKQVEEDMNNLMNTKAKGFIKKQLGEKFFKDDTFKLPEEYTTNKNKLSEFVEQLADESDKGVLTQMWKRAKGNSKNENPEIKQNALNTLTILSHLNQRKEDISNIPKIESKKTLNWTIKMWDRNPQKDIFQGNYSTCCIGMGECNRSAMPHFVMDTAYNMIELTNENGKTTGNALCYFVKDEKGQPAFIIDNIEINNSEKPSDEICIELRNKMAEYASLVAKDVTGRDDIPVYMSSHYNDVPTNDLERHTEKVSFIGDVDSNTDQIYMDLYSGWEDTDKLTQNVELLKLR